MKTTGRIQSKSITSILASLVTSLVAIGWAVAGSSAAHAGEAGAPLTKTVNRGDLNLDTEAGAIASAVADVNRSAVTALHAKLNHSPEG